MHDVACAEQPAEYGRAVNPRSELTMRKRAFTRRRFMPVAATLVALAPLLGACGTSGPSVAHLGGKTNTTSQPSSVAASGGSAPLGSPPQGCNPPPGATAFTCDQVPGVSGANALKFAACMRTHGLPSFPDPNADGVFSFDASPSVVGPEIRGPQQTCQSLLHLGGGPPSPAESATTLARFLKWSRCMRNHGLPSFPDPQSHAGGGITLQITPSSGIDPSSPIFERAQKACASLQPSF